VNRFAKLLIKDRHLQNYTSPFFLLNLLAITFFMGCTFASDDPELGLVEGTITLDGEPLANANVVFNPLRGKQSTGKTDSEGHYSLTYLRDTKGAVVGKHIVRISTWSEFTPKELVPPAYNRNSELSVNVKPGSNSFDFELRTDVN